MNPHQDHPTSFSAMLATGRAHHGLVRQLVRREIAARYRGSILGLAWSFFNPILMLLVYTFVFSVVFRNRWGGGVADDHVSFAIVLFVGMIIHALFAEVANRAPLLIVHNVSYVKRVVFPLEILPVVAMGAALFHALISLSVLLLAQYLLTGSLSWTLVFFPLLVAPLVIATTGVGWFLAALGVYIRDVAQTIGIITTIMLFMAPIFYPVSVLSPKLQLLLYLNPLTFVIEEGRKVLLFGQVPNWPGWFLYSLLSLAVAKVGFWWFQKTRKGFADVV
ncbi:MAG: ABC transporter permease [Chromatiaceae bacterium]|nr:MAG: ABC transporter permease [Chromatiaceae bacterium]